MLSITLLSLGQVKLVLAVMSSSRSDSVINAVHRAVRPSMRGYSFFYMDLLYFYADLSMLSTYMQYVRPRSINESMMINLGKI